MIFNDVLFVETIREHSEKGVIPSEAIRAYVNVQDIADRVTGYRHTATRSDETMAFLGITRSEVRKTRNRRCIISIYLRVVQVFGVR